MSFTPALLAMSQDFFSSLELMGKGMLGIFVVIGAIALIVALLGKFTRNKQEQKED